MEKESQKTEQEIKLEQAFIDISCLLWTEIKKDLPFFGGCGFIAIHLFWIEAFFERWFPNRDLGSLAEELRDAFMSFGTYSLLMFGLITIGSIANILYCFKQQYVCLNNMYVCFNNMVKHVECKFTQLISITISFALGVTLAALLHTIFADTLIGVLFVALSVAFIIYIFVAKDVENRLIQLMDVAKWYPISVALIALLHTSFTGTSSGMWLVAFNIFFIMYIFAFSMMVYFVTWRIEPLKVRQIWDKRRSSAFVLVLIFAAILLALIGYEILMIIFPLTFVFLTLVYKKWREGKQQQV